MILPTIFAATMTMTTVAPAVTPVVKPQTVQVRATYQQPSTTVAVPSVTYAAAATYGQ